MEKYLQIIENSQDKKMFQEVISFLKDFSEGMSPIQIENFVLNDIEFPTSYGKFQQSKFELYSRFNQLIDLYYDIQEKKIKIKQKERKILNSEDDLEKELLELQKEKLEIQLLSLESRVKTITKEASVFFKVYQEHPQFHKLTPKETFQLEAKNWTEKTKNMPDVFYQRYGKKYLYKALGKEVADRYLELQRKTMGLLPREFFEVKQIEGEKK